MEYSAVVKDENKFALEEQACHCMVRARSALVMEHPFFGALVLRLNLQEDTACKDLWTDGRTMGYNPVYAATLPQDRLVGAQAHEVLHLAFGHHLRRKDRDTSLWNRACDLSINQLLLDAGFSLPEGFVHDPAYAGMAADDIYESLFQMQEKEANKGARDNLHTAPGDEDDDAAPTNADGGRELGVESTAGSGGGDDNGGEESGAAAAMKAEALPAKESRRKRADAKNQTSFTGEVRDHPGLEGMHNDRPFRVAEQEADIALNQAMQSALHMGSMPAGFLRLLKQEWRLNLDWRELLRRFIEQCADNDYSWTAPNRRYLHQNIYLPSRNEARLPHVALAVDSSGSVDEESLAAFCGELSSVLEEYDTTLSVLFHDNRVQSAHTFTRMDLPLVLHPQGGGGTDFRPVCEYIEENIVPPACLIWFTDMECSLFPDEPAYPVLWVCSRPDPQPPPFGEVVTLAEQRS